MAKRSRPKTRSANEDCQNVIKMWVAPRSLMTKSVLCKRSNICRYREAGIVTIPDRNIAKKIIELYDLYLAIKKKKSLTTKGATDQRASFKESLTALFDVSSDNAEDLIRADSSRSKKRKEEDQDQPGGPAIPLDRTENQDQSFPILPSTSRNNNNNNVVLQDEDVEESEDDREDGELGTDDSEPDSVSDKIGNEDTGNNNEAEEEETSDIGRQYLAIRAGNIAERQQLLKQMFPDKEAVNIQKPRKKKAED